MEYLESDWIKKINAYIRQFSHPLLRRGSISQQMNGDARIDTRQFRAVLDVALATLNNSTNLTKTRIFFFRASTMDPVDSAAVVPDTDPELTKMFEVYREQQNEREKARKERIEAIRASPYGQRFTGPNARLVTFMVDCGSHAIFFKVPWVDGFTVDQIAAQLNPDFHCTNPNVGRNVFQEDMFECVVFKVTAAPDDLMRDDYLDQTIREKTPEGFYQCVCYNCDCDS